MKIEAAGGSDKGRVRETNEDTWLCDPKLGLFLISDGMGGAAAGEIAAAMVRQGVAEKVSAHKQDLKTLSKDSSAVIKAILEEVNEDILEHSETRDSLVGMGATLVMGLLRDEQLHISNVGDSRCYRFSNKKFKQITKDHSLVQALVDAGQLTPEEAEHHPEQACLTQCMGMRGSLKPQMRVLDLKPGERVLFCSDGLHTMVEDEELIELMYSSADPKPVVKHLIDAANKAGGYDNITALAIFVNE